MTHPLDTALAVRSDLVRKGIAYALQAPRALRGLTASVEDYQRHPPIVVNSIPKSGTHLLLQVARSLPGTRYYGSFLAWASSRDLVARSPGRMAFHAGRIVPGEVLGAHIHHQGAVAERLAGMGALHAFIIRDPVDALLSEAHYLGEMAPYHRMAGEFRPLGPDERIEAALKGSTRHPDLYPGFRARLAPYLPWLEETGVHVVRFETLRARPAHAIGSLLEAWRARLPAPARPDAAGMDRLMQQAITAIAPDRSHTASHRQREPVDAVARRLAAEPDIRALRRALGYSD